MLTPLFSVVRDKISVSARATRSSIVKSVDLRPRGDLPDGFGLPCAIFVIHSLSRCAP